VWTPPLRMCAHVSARATWPPFIVAQSMGPWDMYVPFGGGLLSVRSSRLLAFVNILYICHAA
jgi:hypothetical protein